MQSFFESKKCSEFVLVSLTVDKIASWLNFSLCAFAWIIHASNNKTNNLKYLLVFFTLITGQIYGSDSVGLLFHIEF